MQEIEIISAPTEIRPFLVINKPQGIPSAPLSAEDNYSALIQASKLFPQIKSVKGLKEIEYGLIHRIDTETSGLLLIACTQEFYDFIQTQQMNGNFIKRYKATCIHNLQNTIELGGFPPINKNIERLLNSSKEVEIASYFRNYGPGKKEVRPVTEESCMAALKKLGKPKEYRTKIIPVKKDSETVSFLCEIKSGYRHQVRCHLAWAGFPIIGDKTYNINAKKEEKMLFEATELEFFNPVTDAKELISL